MTTQQEDQTRDDHAAEFHKSLVLRLRELERQLDELETEQGDLQGAIDAIEKVRTDLRQRYARPGEKGVKLRGKDAVLEVLRASAGRWMNINEIVDELQLRDWMEADAKAPHEAARVSLRKLYEEGAPISKDKDGRRLIYQFKNSEAPNMGASDAREGSPDGPAS